MTTNLELLKNDLELNPSVFSDGNIFQVENAAKRLDKFHLIAIAIGLHNIRSKKLYTECKGENFKNFKEYFLSRGEEAFSFGYKEALRYSEIGEAFSKYKKELEDTGYEEKYGLQKLRYLPKALDKNQKDDVFDKLKKKNFKDFKEYAEGKPGTTLSLRDKEKKIEKKQLASEDKEIIKSLKLKVKTLEDSIKKKSKEEIKSDPEIGNSPLSYEETIKNLKLEIEAAKENMNYILDCDSEEEKKISSLSSPSAVEKYKKDHEEYMAEYEEKSLFIENNEKKIKQLKEPIEPINHKEPEKTEPIQKAEIEEPEYDSPFAITLTNLEVEDIILYFKNNNKSAKELFCYILNKLTRDTKKEIMEYFNKVR